MSTAHLLLSEPLWVAVWRRRSGSGFRLPSCCTSAGVDDRLREGRPPRYI